MKQKIKNFLNTTKLLFIIFVVPYFLYFFIKKDPIVLFDSNGYPVRLGIYITVGLYWMGIYFVSKYRQSKKEFSILKKLIKQKAKAIEDACYENDKALREAESEFENFINNIEEEVEEKYYEELREK